MPIPPFMFDYCLQLMILRIYISVLAHIVPAANDLAHNAPAEKNRQADFEK